MMMDEIDGWEDDDDLDDELLSDEEYDHETNNRESTEHRRHNDEAAAAFAEREHNGDNTSIPMGQGFLVGRLSRFIEAVTTQPDDEDEAAMNDVTGTSSLGLGGGWDEDVENEGELVRDDDDDGWDEEDIMLDDDEEEEKQPSQPTTTEPEPSSGWDDDDLDALDDVNDDHDGSLHQEEEQAKPSSQPTLPTTRDELPSSGWDDELDGLDDSDSSSLHEESQLEQLGDQAALVQSPAVDVSSSSPQQQQPHQPPSSSPHQGLETQPSGWDDNALDGLDDASSSLHEESQHSGLHDNHDGTVLQTEEQPLTLETAPRTQIDMSSTVPELRPETGEPPPAVAAATEAAALEENAWEGDDDLLLGDDDDFQGCDDDDDDFLLPTSSLTRQQDVAATAVVVDHIPTQRSSSSSRVGGTEAAGESMVTNADESTVLRENAIDEEEFVSSDDYGPVVDNLPSEHLQQQQDHATQTVSTVVPESCTEAMEEDQPVDAEPDPNNVIDHVPDDVSNVLSRDDDSTASVDGDDQSAEMAMQQESVEGGDTADGEYGPIVDRMPSEQSYRQASRTTSTVPPSSFNESLEEETNLLVEESKASEPDGEREVDHIPEDVSNVSTETEDSTASVDGDEAPDLQSREGLDQLDSTDGDFGPVVDNLPSIHSFVQTDGTVSAVAPPSVNDEIAQDDNEAEAEETTSSQAVISIRCTTGFVDHVPDDGSRFVHRNTTLSAATEMSVASELSNTLGDEALESDVDAKEENYGPVVDHTPLQQSIHSRRNPSVRVQAPIEEIDEDDIDEEQYFGPVVDHTPTVQVSTVSSVTGSMAVAAPPSEVDDDSDDRSDTVDDNGEERSNNDHYDDDTLDAPTSSIVSATKIDGPTLVDHVPRRHGSRPTDASTLVVVDPSEVSTVGDMTYEEQQYGPVVDHTPPARPSMLAAAEDSTAVAATTSVGPDDTLVDTLADEMLDGAVGRRSRDDNDSEGDDAATLPTLDNQPPMETNVVDHVPEEGPPMFRIDSVLSTAPTQSVLSPDETRDSEFGLVVDHLPRTVLPSPPSRGSMAVLAPPSIADDDLESGTVEEEASMPAGEQPASERTTEEAKEAKVVVDHLPPVRDGNSRTRPSDSTITVRSHISDDDTLEGIARPDRFGPVVDQLPAASVQRSLGGSTTGALATLSEVNDDTIMDEDTRGWDYDEQELDSIQDSERDIGENGRQFRGRPASRGLSVTFSSQETVKTVQNLDEGIANNGLFSSIADETQYFDAATGDTPSKSVNETQESQYFDPESGVVEDGTEGSSFNQSSLPCAIGASNDSESLTQCHSCVEAKGPTCPCIQSILHANRDENSMVVSVVTPEGLPVEIDVNKLLQHETTKRLLLEEEVKALRSTVGSLETSLSEAKFVESKQPSSEPRESMDVLTAELELIREERGTLASQNKELTGLLASLRDESARNKSASEEYAARESASEAEMDDLRRTCEDARSESRQLASVGNELALEVEQMRSANEELLIELGRQKGQCEKLEAENKRLDDECSSQERRISDMVQEKSDLSSRTSAFQDEILHLRRALEESSLATSSEADLRNQLSTLQVEAANKSGECEELRSQVEQIQKRLQESEGRNFAQMKDSMRVKRQHEGDIQKLQEQLESVQAVVEEREASLRGLGDKLVETESLEQGLRSENDSLKRTVDEVRSEHEGLLRQERLSSQEKTSQIRALEIKVKMLESEKAKASSDLSSLLKELQDSLKQSSATEALKEEYCSLQSTLAVNKETIHSLQEQVEVLSQANKTGTDQMETLVASISSERDSLRSTLQSKETEIQSLHAERHVLSTEKIELEAQLELLASKCGELEASVEDLRSNAANHELELAERDRICESLRESLPGAPELTLQVREQYERQIADLNQLVAESDSRLRLLQSQVDAQTNVIRDRDSTIAELEQQRTKAEELVETMTVDRDNASRRFRDLDAELAHVKKEQTSLEYAVKLRDEKERELRDSLNSLVAERDNAIRERELLEEDNEELLVQLGLVKQQFDAQESESEELRTIATEKEVAVKHAEERLREAEDYISQLTRTNEIRPLENGTHKSGQLAALERTVDELTIAKEDLEQKVDDLSSTNAYIDAQVTALRDEKVELLGKLSELEQLRQSFGSDAAVKEDQYLSKTRELEEQCRHFEALCQLKDEQLEQSLSTMQEAQSASVSSQVEISALQQRISQLETVCAEREHALRDRDGTSEKLKTELEGLRSCTSAQPSATVDYDAVERRLQDAERSTQHYQDRLRELETVLEQARKELKSKTEKLAETESTLFDRDLELDLQAQDRGSTEEDLRKQLHEMDALLVLRNEQIQDMFAREQSMERRLSELQSESSTDAHLQNGPISSNAHCVTEETVQLRAQLSTLQHQLQCSTSAHSEREERARQEVNALTESIEKKKEQIESLEKQLQSLSEEFSSSQDQLVSKEADYRRLSIELEKTRGDQLQCTKTVTSQVLDESSSKEQAESIDNMRSHIIMLAQALERSETQRASAIERLLSERKAHADSLRRLGESVKRFYSSLSYRDA